MGNVELLEQVLSTGMNENLRNEIVKILFKGAGRNTIGIPKMVDHQRKLNNEEIYSRMKTVAGGTEVSVAKLLRISPQAYNNQKRRGAITAKSIIDMHLRTGVSVDWLIGSWDGSSNDCIDITKSLAADSAVNDDLPPKQYLSLVEIYDQQSGNIELKWCLSKHHLCLDEKGLPIPDDFGALLSLIIRYKDESGTPDRVKNGRKRHFQVRRVLAYVLGDSKKIRFLDARAKKLTAAYKSGQIERPGKTEFRLYSEKNECLKVLSELSVQNGLVKVEPTFNSIAWDFLIGPGSMSPRDWVLGKLHESLLTN